LIDVDVYPSGVPRPGEWVFDMAGAPPARHAATGIWQVFRYADVERVLTDHERFSSAVPPDAEGAFEGLESSMASSISLMDPPRHRRLRALVSEAFTPRTVARLERRIRDIAGELLAGVRAHGATDFVHSFSFPLPAIVIAELLGVPPDRRDDFKRWSDDVVSMGMSREVDERGRAALMEMGAYFFELAEERRQAPREDLITALTRAEVDGQRLDALELVGFCVLLLIAGHETTANLLNHTVWCLHHHPEVAPRLRRDPALVPSAIEEVLRFRPPVFGLARRATTDVVLSDQRIAAGERVFVWIAAANRDPAAFPEPERFDIERRPNRHLAFGYGVHFCLGAPLARLEAAIAVPMMIEQLRDLRLDEDDPAEPLESTVISGFRRLPVRYTPTTVA
jgi:cytochrome P450